MIATHLGFYNTSSTRTHVRFQFSTHAAAGGNVAPNSAFEAADLRIYRANDGAAFSATQRSSANGITMTSPFDSLTGFHDVDIDLTDNSDAGYYAAGYLYSVVLSPDETVDSQTLTGVVLAYFEIGAQPVNVTHFGGTAGTFASGIPAVNATQLSGDSTAADNAEAFFDGTGYAGTNNVIPTVTTLTGHTAQTGDSYAIVNSGTHGNAALKALIDAVDNFVDTEIADIQARLPAALTAGGNMKADALAWAGAATQTTDVALTTSPTNFDALAVTAAGKTTVGTNDDKANYRLSATGVDDILDEVIEGSFTLRQMTRLFAAALVGKLSGGNTTTVTIRDTGDSVDRVVATVDADGNRSAVTLDAS